MFISEFNFLDESDVSTWECVETDPLDQLATIRVDVMLKSGHSRRYVFWPDQFAHFYRRMKHRDSLLKQGG